ncbi:hypothetical protein G8770_14625 [Aestuariicella hydrocarbonica]|uniref:Uncharacterized protein n=1 Tax=Pseudomaricurvus hydrocarbonicus TaxID=1470433 RepID=A0A9E5K109_9GAMM|nr:hypothetical protein [Aestuariicella hydrocarbonica]NHO66782.1 hypothetical protein [Aestuariicella hydrocarbonica]
MTPTQIQYLVQHTLISVIISCAIGVFFVWLVFGQQDAISLWGTKGLGIDFLPQSFMIAFMGVLMPSLITRKNLQANKIEPLETRTIKLPKNVIVRALTLAFCAMFIGSSIATLVLSFFLNGPISLTATVILKTIYSALVAIAVTPLALMATLQE